MIVSEKNEPPRPGAERTKFGMPIKITVLAGAIAALAAPFLQNQIEYLEGRENLPTFLNSAITFLPCAGIGFLTGIIALIYSSVCRSRRLLLLGFALLFCGPIYFFVFFKAAAAMEINGMADKAKNEIDLAALQAWATKTLRDPHEALKLSSDSSILQAPLDWNKIPHDAQMYLGGINHRAFIASTDENQDYVAAFGADGKVLIVGATNLTLATNEFWNCRLAPGVYLRHEIRP